MQQPKKALIKKKPAKEKEIDPEILLEYTFKLFDHNKDGFVTKDEFFDIFRCSGIFPSIKELEDLVSVAERAAGVPNKIDYDSFLKAWHTCKRKPSTEEDLNAQFITFDNTNRGWANSDQVRQVLMTLGEPLTDKEMTEFLHVSEPYEGEIDYRDFSKKMHKKADQQTRLDFPL